MQHSTWDTQRNNDHHIRAHIARNTSHINSLFRSSTSYQPLIYTTPSCHTSASSSPPHSDLQYGEQDPDNTPLPLRQPCLPTIPGQPRSHQDELSCQTTEVKSQTQAKVLLLGYSFGHPICSLLTLADYDVLVREFPSIMIKIPTNNFPTCASNRTEFTTTLHSP